MHEVTRINKCSLLENKLDTKFFGNVVLVYSTELTECFFADPKLLASLKGGKLAKNTL